MSPKEVLIIEDKLAFRNSIKRALKPDDYTFVEAVTIEQGLQICRTGHGPKVILLDLDLPDGTGRDFLEHLGSARDQYKIIVITAHEDLLAAELADKFAVFNYLPKAVQLRQSLRFSVAQAFNEIEREQLKDKNRILNEIQEQINSSIQESDSTYDILQAMNGVLKVICESVRELVGAYTSHIRVYNLQKGDFHLAAFAGPDEAYARIFAVPKRKKEPFSGLVADKNEKRHFENLQEEKEFQEWRNE
jgi:CheY-like chemotaxis protein